MLVFNANTQQEEEVTWSSDAAGELICTFPDGHFLKFPAGITKEEVVALLAKHKEDNLGHEIITPEMEAAKQAELQASQDLAAALNDAPATNPTINDGNTMPEGSQNDAPTQEVQPGV